MLGYLSNGNANSVAYVLSDDRCRLWFRFWIVVVLVRKLKLDDKLGVAVCLLGQTQISSGQVFKTAAQQPIAFCFGMGEQLKSLRPILVPRRHSPTFIVFLRTQQLCNATAV